MSPWKQVLRWSIPGVPVPLLLLALAPHVAAVAALSLITGIVVVILIAASPNARHQATEGLGR